MKYRMPILQRVPFIIRRPICARDPLVKRRVVFNRKPMSSVVMPYEGCTISENYQDCAGCGYCKPEDVDEKPEIFRLIHVSAQSRDADVVKRIQIAENSQKFLRIVADKPLSQEVLFAAAYSPYNIVQFNMCWFDNTSLLAWRQSAYMADSCGLYIALMIYPIIPTVVKTAGIIGLMEDYARVCDYICLKFFETNENLVPSGGFYNINNHVIPEKYLEKTPQGGLKCSQEFFDLFLSMVNSFVKPRKMNITVCNYNTCY